jgi:peptide/nickel transport system substrate-binding protein
LSKRPIFRAPAFLALASILLAACVQRGAQAPENTPAQSPAAPRVITMTVLVEPTGIHFNGEQAGGGDGDVRYIFHDELFVESAYESFGPQLAVELPAIDRGTWRLNPDGTMDTVWKLRPNIRWHDGTPFTSDDLAFTFRVNKDPAAGQSTRHTQYMQSIETPNPLTFVVHWSSVYSVADQVSAGLPLPRHLLEESYLAGGAPALLESRYFTDDFVGLGPYRLVEWQRGSHIVGARFDQYYQGRPPLDQVIAKFVSDPNTMVAHVLSGAVDVVATGIDVDAAIDVKRRWEGTNNRVIVENTGKLYHLDVQLRPEVARPKDAFNVRGVRQAFYQAIDRSAVAEAISHGLAPAADSYFPPDAPIRKDLEGFIPQFPYDRTHAGDLLDDAGWALGPDGVRSRNGERLEVDIWAHPDATRQKIATIVADYWKAAGAATVVTTIPAARINDREYVYTARPGWWIVTPSGNTFYAGTNKLHSSQIPTAANRWAGANYGAYSNPKADDLLDKIFVAIDPKERISLHQQLVRELMGDVAILPIYWQVAPVLMREGVSGPKPVRNYPTMNIFQWDKT